MGEHYIIRSRMEWASGHVQLHETLFIFQSLENSLVHDHEYLSIAGSVHARLPLQLADLV